MPATAAMTAAFEPPEEFDDYVILSRIGEGQGRMGQLYLAEDTVLARHVAVKFVDAATDLAARQRFILEARTAARVQHPNVVTIHRVGELGDRPYLVTEFVRGKSLAELERPLSWRRALSLGIDLARGLAAAHRQGVIHCDIKPANAMVTEEGAAKLVDFGLATLAVDEPGAQAAAAPRGTPDFMAPEVWDLCPPTRRSDVYSLGAVLYELVAGRTPHADASARELPRVARERDAPPLAGVVPGTDARFAAIVDRCLARDPEARYASGEELRHALERLDRAAVGGAVPAGNPYRGLRPFEAEQRGLFFGRGLEVGAILDRLRLEGLVLVTGDSGVGKSSILRAGVVPAVVDGALGGGREWSVARLVPGARPTVAIADALSAALGEEIDVHAAGAGLGRELARHLGATHGLVLFVDQLEELLTVSDAAERGVAERALAALAEGAAGVRLVATLRADFLSRFAALPRLGQDMARALYFVRPLPPERLRDVVIGPAQAAGTRFENDDVVDELVRATAAADGALPLLSFALAELWEARDVERNVIPAAALEAMGGVAGALARHADATVAALPPDERLAARGILGQLVTPQGTRVRRLEAELAVSPASRGALAALVRGRLLVAHDTGDGEGSAYELAHEVLLEGWATLRRWRVEDAAGRALRERVVAAAEEWRRAGRGGDALWSGRRLVEAEALDADDLPPGARDFLGASRRAERLRRLRRSGLAAAMLALIGAVYGGLKLQARHVVDVEVAALREEAARLSRGAIEHERQRAARAAVAFARFDAGDRDGGEAAWADALVARGRAQGDYGRASRVLEMALAKDAERADTRALLAEVLYARALLAEDDGDVVRRDELVERFRLYDERLLERWEAPARVDIRSTPGGAQVVAGGRALGTTPVIVALPRGAHVLELTAPGRARSRLALLARRGEAQSVSVDLPVEAAVPPGTVYVPAGRFLFGSAGDEAARRGFFDTAPLHARHTGPYLIGRTEVAIGEWLAFIDTLPPDERERRTPGVAAKVGGGGALSLRRAATGWELTLQPLGNVYVLPSGVPLVYAGRQALAAHDWRRLPVTGVSAEDAEAYAAWLRATGRLPRARLCSELEWERAARGADARVYPSGMTLDAADANFDETHGRELIGPDAVGSHPRSDSPYGLSDMSGNAFEWTTSVLQAGQYVGRGGSFFYDRKTIQVVNRAVSSPEIRDASLGVRMCADISPL